MFFDAPPCQFPVFSASLPTGGNDRRSSTPYGLEILASLPGRRLRSCTGGSDRPDLFRLHANAPNPFNPATTIRYELLAASEVTLAVYDVSGGLVRILRRGVAQSAVSHEAVWRGGDESSRPVASGTYFYRLSIDGIGETRRMTLVR